MIHQFGPQHAQACQALCYLSSLLLILTISCTKHCCLESACDTLPDMGLATLVLAEWTLTMREERERVCGWVRGLEGAGRKTSRKKKRNETEAFYKLVKGEVRAICPFWVFDRNRLLARQLIDSCWFDKNPRTEGGWKQRLKKCRSTDISREMDRDVMCSLFFAPSLHAIWLTYTFCIWLRRFVDRWWLKEVWYEPSFFAKALYSCDPRWSKKNTRPERKNLP